MSQVSSSGAESRWEIEYDGGSHIELDSNWQLNRFGVASVLGEKQIEKSRTKEGIIRVIGFAARPNAPGHHEGIYDHCQPVNGKLAWARPPHADCHLFNPEEVRGKVAVVKRGLVDFARKLLFCQEAGAIAMLLIGNDPDETIYQQPLVMYTGDQLGDDLEPHCRTLVPSIPAVYGLQRFEPLCEEGADCFVHFETNSPPPWKVGAVYIKAEKKLRPLRNAEGEAAAQWSEADLDLSGGGGRKAQMIGSDGRIITLAENEAEMAAKPRALEARAAGTQCRTVRECGLGGLVPGAAGGGYTLYGFAMSFGRFEWTVWRRYSDFDRLDSALNAKYGLPPVGLPPKRFFGRTAPELVSARAKVLLAYVCDCVRRPVLVHSPELQAFCQVPPDVVDIIAKGG